MVWGSTYESNLARLIVLQKRVIRIITKSSFDAHTAPVLYDNNLLNLSNIYKLQAGILCSQFIIKYYQECFNPCFSKTRIITEYLTVKPIL